VDVNEKDVILVVAAHPDDEVLGCGGTVRKLADRFGDALPIYCVILSEPLASRTSHAVSFDKKDFQSVIGDSLRVSETLGFRRTYFENLPNNRLDSLDLLDVIRIVEDYAEKLRPTVVFSHHGHDLNLAHRITSRAVLTACRPLPECSVRKLLSFERPSSTEWAFSAGAGAFSPNVFVEIGDVVEIKIEAMETYKSERRAYPHPRSPEMIRANALRWGGVANLDRAEAFELIYERNAIE
jgi:LmbE family N-acetylglucosaminyl deacetylase